MAIMSKQKGGTHFWVPPGIYSAYSSNIRRFLPGTQSRIGTYFIPHNTVDVQWR